MIDSDIVRKKGFMKIDVKTEKKECYDEKEIATMRLDSARTFCYVTECSISKHCCFLANI